VEEFTKVSAKQMNDPLKRSREREEKRETVIHKKGKVTCRGIAAKKDFEGELKFAP
jgi:hypothetical protein